MTTTEIKAAFNLEDLERKDAPMFHHMRGLSYTRTGYGKKIPTATMVRLPGDPRWRRVYCCVYSNIGTCYVLTRGAWTVIR